MSERTFRPVPGPDPRVHMAAASDPGELARVEKALREGLDALREERHGESLAAFRRASGSPALADWAAVFAAEAHARSGNGEAVHEQLSLVPHDLRGRVAWRPETEALRAAGDVPRALRVVLQALPLSGNAGDSARMLRQAGALTRSLGDSTAARHFLARAAAMDPTSTASSAAAQELALLGPVHPEEHEGLVRFHLGRGDLPGAAGAYERMARSRSVEESHLAPVRVRLAEAFLQRGQVQEMEKRFIASGAETPAVLRSRIELLAGRGRLRQGRTAAAVERLETAVSSDPHGAAAQEALYILADLDHDAGRTDRAKERFWRSVRIDPRSEWGGEAAMRLGALAFLDGNYTAAVSAFEAYRTGHDDGWRHQQATYWAGLAYLRLDERETGLSLLRGARDHDPAGFYGLLAAAARGDRGGGAFPPGPPPDEKVARLARGAIHRVRVLERLGRPEAAGIERERAVAVLSRVPGGLHAMAEALHEEGRVVEAVRLGREARRLLGGWDRRLLRTVYPLPFRDEIEAAARRNGLDPFVVAALIRQESLFQPGAVSTAGAVGLMQVMPRTARSLGARLGKEVSTPDRLKDPETNVEVGALHLADLLRAHGGRLDEVLVAYNAGSGRLARWREFPEHRDPQLFLERIPYRETREYVRTVRENAALYASLYSD